MTIYEAPAPRQGFDDGAKVSPDSPDTRLRDLERAVAKLESRVEDLLDRMRSGFENFEGDVRTFAPLVQEVYGLKSDLGYVKERMVEFGKTLKELTDFQAQEARKRAEGQEARAAEDRKRTTLLWVAAIGLLGTFLSTIGVVLAAVLS